MGKRNALPLSGVESGTTGGGAMGMGGPIPPTWDDDEDVSPVLRMAGRIIKTWRDRAGLTQSQLGDRIGYSYEQVASVEQGRRAPKEDFLTAADDVLRAEGTISALTEDVDKAKYPKKVRDLAKWEGRSVEIRAYTNTTLNGLLQTPDYARAVLEARMPRYEDAEVENLLAMRMARQRIIDPAKATPIFHFVQDEMSLRHLIGGRDVMRAQLEHVLEVVRLKNVDVQVLPMTIEDHPGLDGPFKLMRLQGGDVLAYNEVQRTHRLVSDLYEIRMLEICYGAIRSNALPVKESVALIENVVADL
ncbi:helix-turn-helix domain-containing protein [Streptomyces sp. NPDC050560]|uniref:helix-turn-helix domain-containing protein n=1 Tax=Streptomyces sp. NPDC050560 TaxID=3365630 RepID=UPI00379E52B3